MRNVEIAAKFYSVLCKIERRSSRVWPIPAGFIFIVEYKNKLVRAQMLENRGPEEILVYLMDEGCEIMLTRTNRMFVCPNYFVDYPTLTFTSVLNIDVDDTNFPIDSALTDKTFVSKKSTFIRMQIGNKTFRYVLLVF